MVTTDEKIDDNDSQMEPLGLGCALVSFGDAEEGLTMIENLKTSHHENSEKTHERFQFIIGQYKEQPHLLDSHLAMLLEKCVGIVRSKESSMELRHAVFKYMFVFVNVRGYKIIVNQLPHEVADFEPVLTMLEQQDPLDTETWTTRYILLLWLSIIVMIPFPLARFDALSSEAPDEDTIMGRVLTVIKRYVTVTDKCQDAAAYLSARFITRNDVKEQHLSSYFYWTAELSSSPDSNVFVKYGTLSSVAMILKHGKRENLLPYMCKLLQWIIDDSIKNNAGASVQKAIMKIIQRIGLTFLPPRVAAWRYSRGNRSLTTNLCGGDGKPSTASTAEAVDATDQQVPEEVEEVIDQLIQGLRSSHGITRWSAAKGIGRVTSRLPQELADEVVGSILELFSLRESDGAWHGGCLALAELGRRGLLLPGRLPEVVPLILKALVYDEPRGYSSVGSHIRDAACYVCWSFARAYDSQVLQPFVNDIASVLLIVMCFDREINCRRAASASFQENVGRQGTFPHGIDIMTIADFFAVSVRNNSYLNISVYIAQFEEYTIALIDHLLTRKLDHWDSAIRALTAKTLHNLTPKATNYMISKVLPSLFERANGYDLNGRHGAVLAIGEILYSLSKIITETSGSVKLEDMVGASIVDQTRDLIPSCNKKLYFRGIGGELMREACCDFIEKTSLAGLDLGEGLVTDDWLNLINECIAYDVVSIRTGALNALPVLLSRYYFDNTPKQEEIAQNYMHQVSSATQEDNRKGFSLALGALPKFMLLGRSNVVIDCLLEAVKTTRHTEKWAESRRDAIKALTALSTTLEDEIGKEFTEENVHKIFRAFLEGLKDYTQDKRGDVGAWTREASISGLQTLTLEVVSPNPHCLDTELVGSIMAGVAQQAVEKIDRTRALAARVFYSLMYSQAAIPEIPHYQELTKIFLREECETLNWNSAADTFPKFIQLIRFPPYTYSVLLGILCSLGGLTETLVKHSSSAFFAYLKQSDAGEVSRIAEAVYRMLQDYQKVDRVTVPIFRSLERLLSSGCFQSIIDDPESDFTKRLLKLILSEIAGCKDVYKLVDGISVLTQYVQVKNDSCQSALVQLSILLCHRQAYIRKTTSTMLYESLLVHGYNSNVSSENLDEAMQLLSDTNWEESVEVVKPIRNQLCGFLGIRVPVAKAKQ